MICVGIDPGVTTGFASYDPSGKKLLDVKSGTAVCIEGEVKQADADAAALGLDCVVYIEDARLRRWVTGGREKLQGVGSVKRDCHRWQEWCEHHRIAYQLVHPKANKTKLDAKSFARLTGWERATNEHARDAAMLVWGRR